MTVDASQLHALPWGKLCHLARWLGAQLPDDGLETPERRERAVAWCARRVGDLVGPGCGHAQTPPRREPRRR